MTDKPKSTGQQVDEWLAAQTDSSPWTCADVVAEIVDSSVDRQFLDVIKARVHAKLQALKATGKVQQAGKCKPKAGGRRMTAWVKVFTRPQATVDEVYEEREAETPTDPPPDTVTDWQMGRAVYNYIQHLEGQIVREQDVCRKTQDTAKLARSQHAAEKVELQKQLADAKQEVANLQHKLTQATTVRRLARELMERRMAIGKLNRHMGQ